MSADMREVLVIGEGLSGITAAATAAAQGMHATLVSKGPGNFVLGSACVEVEGIDARTLDQPGHESDAAIKFFLDLTASGGCSYNGGLHERRLAPTIMGTFLEVSLAPRSLWKADPTQIRKAVVAGIANMPGFNANFLAERLSFHCKELGLDTQYRSELVTLPHNPKHALTAVEVAARIDRDPDYRKAFIHALRPLVRDAELVIIPGVLGVKSDDADLVFAEEELGCALCELATLPPSVPGLRLLQILERSLAALNVEISTGFAVRKLCIEGGRCAGVELDTPGRPRRLQADDYVLACGRFSQFVEAPPAEFTGCTSPFENVFACGSLLGPHQPQHRNGISILTGYHAGLLASRQGVQYAGR